MKWTDEILCQIKFDTLMSFDPNSILKYKKQK
jgi:hypothetical protein